MYDDLVRDLRDYTYIYQFSRDYLRNIMFAAADAIEQQQQTIDKLTKTNERLRSQVHSLKFAAEWEEDIRRGQVQGMW